MPHISLPPSEVIGRAVAELAEEAGGEANKVRALSKAQYHMLMGDLPIVPTVSGFLVPSGSRAGVIHRVSTASGACDCEAGQRNRYCWHLAVIHVLERCAQYATLRITQKVAADLLRRQQAAEAAMNELYI